MFFLPEGRQFQTTSPSQGGAHSARLSSPLSWGDTDTTTVCGAWLWKFKCFHPKTRLRLNLGAEPEASGQGPSTPLCSKLQLQNQAAGGPTLARASASAAPSTQAARSFSGSLPVHEDAISTSHPAGPRRVAANLLRAELTRLAPEPGRPRTGGPGRAGSHLPRGRTPGRPRLHPTALSGLPDTHVPSDSPL